MDISSQPKKKKYIIIITKNYLTEKILVFVNPITKPNIDIAPSKLYLSSTNTHKFAGRGKQGMVVGVLQLL